LAAGGDPAEGIPESGKHCFGVTNNLGAHGPELRVQAMGFEFRLDDIDSRAQMS
jgi:hypothetical protein